MPELREADLIRGQEAYLQYATGVALVNDPARLAPIYAERSLDDPQCVEEILCHAEGLMFEGLVGVIRNASQDADRTRLSKLEDRFDLMVTPMYAIVRASFDSMTDRLEGLNPILTLVRPNPILDRVVYRSICHSRLPKIKTMRLLDGIMPSVVFDGVLSPDRGLESMRRHARIERIA